MASYLTDEVRERNYAKWRKQKKHAEGILDICMWILIATLAINLIPAAAEGLLFGLFIGDMKPFLRFLLDTALGAYAVFAIYKKDWRITAIGILAMLLIDPFSAIVLVACVFPHYILQQLAKKEGWPHFDITYQEQEERKAARIRMADARAIEAGARIPSTQQEEPMHDLLDSGRDVMPIFRKPSAYHDRSRNGVIGEQPRSIQPGVMDTLEVIGNPAQTESSDPNNA